MKTLVIAQGYLSHIAALNSRCFVSLEISTVQVTKIGIARPVPEAIFFMLNSDEHEYFPVHEVTVGILTFMSRKNSILGLSEAEKKMNFLVFYTYEHVKFHAQLS